MLGWRLAAPECLLTAAQRMLQAERAATIAKNIEELEAAHGVKLPRDAAGVAMGRNLHERIILHTIYGELRSLRDAAVAYRDHWTAFLLSDYSDDRCC